MIGMNQPNLGHVQVKFNGTWGTICAGHGFSSGSAEVICRQLRQGPPVKNKFLAKNCPAAYQGTKTVWLFYLDCRGFEDSIEQCTHSVLMRIDGQRCSFCTQCSICLLCQPFDANITGEENKYVLFHLSIVRFHLMSRRPYWCSKTKKRWPYW